MWDDCVVGNHCSGCALLGGWRRGLLVAGGRGGGKVRGEG
uniref:Uncharacterized protein n=1 Tax=Anguilla anguilla TaxID=7936 RepID=A0A0E9VC36_ANGAN